MLFSEIYGSYYKAVGRVLAKAVEGNLDKKSLNQIIQEEAFGESMLTIPESMLGGKWGLLNAEYETPLTQIPEMPMTLLQKRWLKALLLDPRIQLFQPDSTGLEDITPLFRPEWIVYYDRYTDGDNFADADYIRNFRTILTALRENKQLKVTFTDRLGTPHNPRISPQYLEYSEKDDRFRLVAEGIHPWTINLARLESCCILDEESYQSGELFRQRKSLTLELTDERNAMERVLLHFSHLEKETKRLDDIHYRITLHYDKMDETEILIRILSFGPQVEVISPAEFREKIRHRLTKQLQNPILVLL